MIQLPPPNEHSGDESGKRKEKRSSNGQDSNTASDPASKTSAIDMSNVLDTLRKTKAGMQRVQERLREPLAVVGMGCRFPGAFNPDEYWQLLDQGHSIDTVPGDRWDESLRAEHEKQPGQITANRSGWLDGIDQFDSSFFGISGREAASLDPQQRLLLEIAWETFENAGIVPKSARGKRVGAFVGICSNDYLHRLTRRGLDSVDTYLSTGNAHGAAAGRLSYAMDWRGPSVAIDTACSSSLTALHLAARSLRYGDCDMAIAMGVNVILAPELSVSFSQAGMLSPTGRCHTFSANADGFVRGEGCGAVLLKRLRDALRDGDTIHCVVRGTATNQDGRSVGLTAPNGTAQQAVIREALKDAGLTPQQIDYIEAHGTGTPLGDPIEVDALRQVFAPTRRDDRPLQIGSVKTNFGHLEGAAGIAGVIKVALAIKNQTLPSHLHCDEPNEAIDWQWPVEIPTDTQRWKSKMRVAGVSSFGFGGSNAHVILSETPAQNPLSPNAPKPGTIVGDVTDESSRPSPESLFVLSAKSPQALREYAQRFADHLEQVPQRLVDICYSAATTREAFDHRIAFVVESTTDLMMKLRAFANGETSLPEIALPNHSVSNRRGELVIAMDGDRTSTLSSLAESFMRGDTVDWSSVFAEPVRRIELPTYPFQRIRRWIDDSPVKLEKASVGGSRVDRSIGNAGTEFAMLGHRIDTASEETIFQTDLSQFDYLSDHVVRGSVLFPASGLLELVLAAACATGCKNVVVQSMQLHRPIMLKRGQSTLVQILVSPIERSNRETQGLQAHVRIAMREGASWTRIADGQINHSNGGSRSDDLHRLFASEDKASIRAIEHYQLMREHGLDYGLAFSGLRYRTKAIDGVRCYGETVLPSGLTIEGYQFHPAWLDACFQVAASVIPDLSGAWVPVGFDRARLIRSPSADEKLKVVANISELAPDSPMTADDDLSIDLSIWSSSHQLVAEIRSMMLKPIQKRQTTNEFGDFHAEPNSVDADSLRQHLHQRIACIMGLETHEVPMRKSLDSLGLDSLMAFELRDEMQSQYQIDVPLEMFFESITLETVLDRILDQIEKADHSLAKSDDWVEGAL